MFVKCKCGAFEYFLVIISKYVNMNATITISAVAALAFGGTLAYNYYTATTIPDNGSAFPNVL